MARSKKSRQTIWQSILKNIQDERVSKIMAILCFMIALFILISSVSYFFTWKQDQDLILTHSWKILLLKKIIIANWLGKVGALCSHFLFYYGFGLAALLMVPILVHLGFRFLHRGGWFEFLRFSTHSMVIMSLLSMIFYYIFNSLEFPFGGAFGAQNCAWIESFMGPIGAGLSLMFGLIALLVWYYNPSMQSLQAETLGQTAESSIWNADWFNFSSALSAFNTENKPSPEQFLKTNLQTAPPEKPVMIDWSEYPEGDPLTASLAPDEAQVKSNPTLEIIEESPSAYEADSNDTELSENQLFQQAVSDDEDGWDTESMPNYDPQANLSSYRSPGLDLLNDYADHKFEIDRDELESNKNLIIATLQHYKIEIQKIKATIGPTVTLYEIVPAPGVRISRIKSLEDDIALSLSAQGIRIIAPIPGRGTIGIEVANKNRQIVALKDLLRSEKFNDPKLELPIVLGKNISNEVIVTDLTKLPHLLIAGATGQGKSVGINSILMSLIYRKHPSEVKLVLIDPKKVELPIYAEIEKHFLARLPDSDEAIITDNSKVIYTLNSLCIEMDQRYELLKMARVRNVLEYNQKFTKRKLNPEKGHRYLPYIVLIIDEFADLIMTAGKEVEMPLGRLAQLARAVGIHLIIATQRPSVKIITGLIKANFPGRIAFKVSSNIDSRTILDYGGAERLIGRGDFLFSVGADVIRLQCPYVDTPEVERVIKFISTQQSFGTPYLLPEYKGEESANGGDPIEMNDLDDLLFEAARLVVSSQHGSTSMIQRRLKLGYNRAGRIMDQLEQLGIVSMGEGSKPREVLVFTEVELENVLSKLKR